jgi:hypothetical protein
MAAATPYRESRDPAPKRTWRGARVFAWILCTLAVLAVAVYVASFFLDPIVRSRVETSMNQHLKGYHTRLTRAHVQLLSGTLTLSGLIVKQDAHPDPPVADLPEMKFSIQLRELAIGHVVGDVLLTHPRVHINLPQLATEAKSKVPLKQEGWQDAIQSVYPFKINVFRIWDGEVSYIDTDPQRPLYLKNIELTADNIRNIRSKDLEYPSPFRSTAIVFDDGRLSIDGRANFLDEPYPGILANYSISRMPLEKFEPVAQHANLHVYQGILESKGVVEYSPKIARVDVASASIDAVHLDYVHTSQTAPKEKEKVQVVKSAAKKANNAPTIELNARDLELTNSEIKFINNAANPHYTIAITDANLHATNLSNHQSQGNATIEISGKLMGSGDTKMNAVFRPDLQGPDFNFDLATNNTDLTAFNDFLKAYGRFDVASGKVSVFAQVSVKQHNVTGYVKPLFTDIKVYEPSKDKKKPLLHQVYEMAIGGAAKLLKNRSTKEVATKVDISGPISGPNVDTWQAVGQFIANAFVNAILPGFDREVAQARAGKPPRS